MKEHAIGGVVIRQVIEQRGAGFTPDFLYPDWDPRVLEEHKALMVPECFEWRRAALSPAFTPGC